MTGIEHVTLAAGAFELRVPRPDDAEATLAMLQDPDVRQWNPGPDELTLESARDWLVRSADWSGGSAAVWTVHDGDQLVGNAFVCKIDPDQLDAWVAYRTAPWARGRGVAASAVLAMTAFAFDALGVERLVLPHAVANAASCRVAEKAGYAYEGLERGGYRDESGVRWDSPVHGRLRDGILSRS
ncbi:MAG: GNAT family N-acetyltransferase [Nocardioidaceae bacterium]